MNTHLKYYAKHNLFVNKKINKIAAYNKLDNDKILEKYNSKFLEIFKNAFNNSKFYKDFYRKNGIFINDIKDITDINKLPVINKNIIKNNINEIFVGNKYLKIKAFTSGTSGSPLTVFRTPRSILNEEAYLQFYRTSNGFNEGRSILSIKGFLGKNEIYKYDKKQNKLFISGPNINESNIRFLFSLIKEFNPVSIEAFPSYLFKFVTELEKINYHIKIPVSFTSSETLYEFQRLKIESYLNTIIYDWYGNVERTIAIAQNLDKEYYTLPLYSINEYKKNKIITTSLINKSFPLIRYEVDDIIKVESNELIENIVCPKIKSIEGRASEYIELKDGSIISCIDHAFKGISHLEMAQVHQNKIDKSIEIKVVVTEQYNNNDEAQLKENIKRLIGNEKEFIVRKCKYEELDYNNQKKYKLIIKK